MNADYANRLLLTALLHPDRLPALPPADWELLIRVARRARLLGRLQADLAALNLLDRIPPPALSHLTAARAVIEHRRTLIAWEVDRLLWALDDAKTDLILLKGAAYILADLPPARGRLFADVDLLAPESAIGAIETRLTDRGWLKLPIDPYDDRYYRVWMHEIPPLRHAERGTEIDIHHRILPRFGRFRSDPVLLLRAARPLANPRLKILAPADMVLHALAHLLSECDPQDGMRLRDLFDAHLLLQHFGRTADFWHLLVPRAYQLGLQRPLFYGLRFSTRFFNTPIPEPVTAAVGKAAPRLPLRALMDTLITLALLPGHPDFPSGAAKMARLALYLRAHWLRMPLFLLLRHLVYKTYLRCRGVPKHVDLTKLDLRQQ